MKWARGKRAGQDSVMKRFPVTQIVPRLLLGALSLAPLGAWCAESRDEKVRRDRLEFAGSTQWIYNDLDKGFSMARAEGKPLLVVLRCVP
jgi:hypothetical protein